MRIRSISRLVARLAPLIVLASGALVASSCFQSDSIDCLGGLVCPTGTECALNQAVCITDNCGNGVVDQADGETCDDGNIIDGDGCSANCGSDETCGNGVVDTSVGEVCDDGNTVDNDGCAADCRSNERCGNGNVDADVGEVCDDGNNDSGDGCSADCLSNETCGNGYQDNAVGEICDDGNNDSGDGCSDDCLSNETCGNGYLDTATGEVCDDGNTIDGDDCSANCKSDETCGNGIVDTVKMEVCDDGNNVDGDGCRADCKGGAGCHNGLLDSGEQCDDGNALDDDACVDACKVARCGDDHVWAGVEQCDPGPTLQAAGCNVDCTTSVCGDNKVNINDGEQCDDGNSDDTDACVSCVIARCGDGFLESGVETCDPGIDPATCNFDCTTSSCHDGKVNPAAGEQCDDGNTADTDACVGNCVIAYCGDGLVRAGVEDCDFGATPTTCNFDCTASACHDGKINAAAGEQCDDNNTDDTDACVGNCQRAFCGDGFVENGVEDCDFAATPTTCNFDCTTSSCHDGKVNPSAGEQCDDNNSDDTDACVGTCQVARCGDGYVQAGVEQCDWVADPSGCNTDCTTSTCGDGKINPLAGEVCDDGNTDDTDGCTNSCQPATCGDGVVQAGVEECDDGDTDNTDDCLNDCTFNTCGDGYRDISGTNTEACDDGNQVSEGECPYGTQSCTTCNADCSGTLSLTGRFCGDGTPDPEETCDDGNTVNETACAYGLTSCSACNSTCNATLNPTVRFCGDGTMDPEEACDDGNADACGTCSATCQSGGSAAAASGTITTVSEANLVDGETFTLDDGANAATVFEIDMDGNITAGNVKVDVSTDVNANQVRDRIIAAINGVTTTLTITASSGGTAKVNLVNDTASALGNTTSAEIVGDPDFVLTDMTGGVGADCADGTGCTSNADCASGTCDTTTTHTCIP